MNNQKIRDMSHSMKEEILREFADKIKWHDEEHYIATQCKECMEVLNSFLSQKIDLIESQTEKRVREETLKELYRWLLDKEVMMARRMNEYDNAYFMGIDDTAKHISALLNK